jgi:hypothetical protein
MHDRKAIAERFKALNDVLSYRTFYARMSSERLASPPISVDG